jgi:FxsC-like protein
MNYRVTVSDFENEPDRLLTMGPPNTPALLLLDRWALDSPRVKELMAQLAEQQRPWISVMIPQHRDDAIPPERDRQLQELTDRVLAARQVVGSGHRSPGGAIRTLEAFQLELQKAVRQAANYYETHAKTYPPKGPPTDPPRLPRLGYHV